MQAQAGATAHAGAVEDFLDERLLIARSLNAVFVPPPLREPQQFTTFAARALKVLPHATAAGWIARVEKSDLPDALAGLKNNGLSDPEKLAKIRRPDPSAEAPEFIVMDVYPKDGNLSLLGLNAAEVPNRLATMQRAKDTHDVAVSEPTPLIQEPAATGVIFYAPVYSSGTVPIGYFTVAWRLDKLLQLALEKVETPSASHVGAWYKTGDTYVPISLRNRASSSPADIGPNTLVRPINFGGVILRLSYQAMPLPFPWPLLLWPVAVFFLFLTTLFFLLSSLVLWWRRSLVELQIRTDAERQLHLVARELNHRFINIVQLADAIVSQTLRTAQPDATVADLGAAISGRLQAIALPTRLLLETGADEVQIRDVVFSTLSAAGERIQYSGPQIGLTTNAAKMLGLLLYELLTNSLKHGALSTTLGTVQLQWFVENEQAAPTFRLTWQSQGGPPYKPTSCVGFGTKLIGTIVPRELHGTVKIQNTELGFRYELTAPLNHVEKDKAHSAVDLQLGRGAEPAALPAVRAPDL
jgi:two-component sensor histidine kinase